MKSGRGNLFRSLLMWAGCLLTSLSFTRSLIVQKHKSIKVLKRIWSTVPTTTPHTWLAKRHCYGCYLHACAFPSPNVCLEKSQWFWSGLWNADLQRQGHRGHPDEGVYRDTDLQWYSGPGVCEDQKLQIKFLEEEYFENKVVMFYGNKVVISRAVPSIKMRNVEKLCEAVLSVKVFNKRLTFNV